MLIGLRGLAVTHYDYLVHEAQIRGGGCLVGRKMEKGRRVRPGEAGNVVLLLWACLAKNMLLVLELIKNDDVI
jgi:hypothetical protein